MARDRAPVPNRRRRSAAVEAALARPSVRQLSRRDRERLQRRVLLAAAAGILAVVIAIVGFGAYREFLGYPGEPVAIVGGEPVTLRVYTDALRDEMRRLQAQVGSETRDQTNPGQMGGSIQNLISAQETLPEDVLEKQIESTLIRQEAARRGVIIPPNEVDRKINENLSIQRAILAQPTSTPTETPTPRPTRTAFPEGFEPSPTATPTPTWDPTMPTATRDPLTPTATREPFPTRPSATPVLSPTPAPTLDTQEFDKAWGELRPLLRSESLYRQGLELELIRPKLRDAVGASVPTSGPQAHVLRLSTSTKDEAKVALIQLLDFNYEFEELVAQTSERPAGGRVSGDLGWVAKGAEAREFDDVVFGSNLPLNEWTPEPFQAGNHWEIVKVLGRRDGAYDEKNKNQMRDRAYEEWLEAAKQSDEIRRDLGAQERQWAVDRASKGIFEETTERRSRGAQPIPR